MNIADKTFHRLFSLNMYKSLRLPLGKLGFSKDFVKDERGDLYPLLKSDDRLCEYIKDNIYTVEQGRAERLMGQFFPYATYELIFEADSGKVGFSFNIKGSRATLLYNDGELIFEDGAENNTCACGKLSKMIVTCRPGAFDVYSVKNQGVYYITSFESEAFKDSDLYESFSGGFVSFIAEGKVKISGGSFFIDSGVSQADLRPVTYEDGTAICEGGKIFLTASIRSEGPSFQGVFSWVPGTSDFGLVGAIYYDAGDGRWCGDVAASVVFNRMSNEWNLWVCSFAHDHVLGSASFKGDPRFGINVIDIKLMSREEDKEENEDSFSGKPGDEDPAFIYDKENNRWLMAICRLDHVTRKYRYRFYESDNPFTGYKFIGKGYDGEETGGSFVNIEERLHFVCGNSFSLKSDYRIYNAEGMKNAKFDFCDGGFRGWGTLIPVMKGSRKRYFWLTFDRHNGSAYNWSYGNVYCFEMIV